MSAIFRSTSRRRRVDLVEVVLIAAVVMVATRLLTITSAPAWSVAAAAGASDSAVELEALARAYGPGKSSQGAEEWIVRDFLHDKRGGVFLDVGSNDYRFDSNTYFLETGLGWSGVAIDAQREYADGYRDHRPKTQFFALFVSDTTDSSIEFYVPRHRRLNASSNRQAADLGDGESIDPRHVPTITLDDLLGRVGIDRLDFVSMDIELAEPKALAGFDIERFAPALLCVEAHPSVRQAILDYFHKHDYVVVGKYLRADTENLYFTPARGSSSPSQSR